MKMQRILLILKNWKAYRHWKARKKGQKFRDFHRGAGYYLITDPAYFFTERKSPKGQIWKTEMESGETGIFELIDYENYRDPSDMVKHSWWHFIGYENCKPIHECSFQEFLSLYVTRKTLTPNEHRKTIKAPL